MSLPATTIGSSVFKAAISSSSVNPNVSGLTSFTVTSSSTILMLLNKYNY